MEAPVSPLFPKKRDFLRGESAFPLQITSQLSQVEKCSADSAIRLMNEKRLGKMLAHKLLIRMENTKFSHQSSDRIDC